MLNVLFLGEEPEQFRRVFTAEQRRRIAEAGHLLSDEVVGAAALSSGEFRECDVLFSTWGMPLLSDEQLSGLPRLKAVFYAAGATEAFARPLLERGILLTSAWMENAVPVAEFALAQIILSLKNYFRDSQACKASPEGFHRVPAGPGAYGERVGLIGDGAVSTRLKSLLENVLEVRVQQLPTARAIAGEGLPELFRECYVVSNHLPDLPQARGVLDGALFASMRRGATFVNTGRGAQVKERELAAVLRERPDLTALLDVTWPEPPAPESPLRALPNVHFSSHLAGSVNDETHRMAEAAIQEFLRFQKGEALRHLVTLEQVSPFWGKG